MVSHEGRKYCLFLLFCTNIISTLTTCADEEKKLYLIRHPGSGLVLDATSVRITVQHFTGFSAQLWRFVRGSSPGLFYIVSDYTGKVIDFEKDNTNNPGLFVNIRSNSLDQQWFINGNGRISNAANGWNMDIYGAIYVPGNKVGIYVESLTENQHLLLQQRTIRDVNTVR